VAEPITLDQAKAHLRVDGSAEDDDIGSAIIEAREAIEDYTGLVLTPRTVVEAFDGFDPVIALKSWPVASITSIGYLDVDGAAQVAAGGTYRLAMISRPARVVPLTCWPRSLRRRTFFPSLHSPGSPEAVTVNVVAGYATPGDIPTPIVRALKLMLGHFYTNRAAVEAGVRAAAIELPLSVQWLLRKYRRRTL
jgi:uncharacterized phiE125 gp8 family phage protein